MVALTMSPDINRLRKVLIDLFGQTSDLGLQIGCSQSIGEMTYVMRHYVKDKDFLSRLLLLIDSYRNTPNIAILDDIAQLS